LRSDLYLYGGCLIPTRLSFLERSSLFVLDKLEIGHEALPDATCCVDPIGLRSMGHDTWLAMSARLLAIAERDGKNILPLCNGCYMSLKEARHLLADDQRREEVNKLLEPLGFQYQGKVDVIHFAELIRDEGAERIKKLTTSPQDRFHFAAHPGCHLLRPSQIMKVDRSFAPRLLGDIASWTGADVVHSEEWPACCGGGLAGVDDAISNAMLERNVSAFKASGANAILTPCPFCFVQFDLRQKQGLPVLYLSELLALAFGATPEEIGLKYHRIKVPV
jgi:heterodisulfide reductase subunit B